MKADTLLQILRITPFRAFELHISDNRSFIIDHPEFVGVSAAARTVLVFADPDEDNNFQVQELVDLAHVTSVTINVMRRSRPRRRAK